MFDSVNLKEAINDLYDYGVKDDNLSLIYKANEEIQMAIKTPGGLTDRQRITNSVLQGDTWGSMMASVQVDTFGKAIEEEGIGYLYKNVLPITMLGLVDDVVLVTDTGYKAQQMNMILNVKTSEKGLQFGINKCKSLTIGNQENCINSDLFVDSWKQELVENKNTGENTLVERYIGELPIGKTTEYKYLGFIISAKGDNNANIKARQNKSIGIIKTILHKLEIMKLKKYYFECAMVYFNVILRGSILYASETYYNLTENNLRNIEKIEEGFLRKILRTQKGCPISQLYLETGQWPARFQITKLRLLFLKSILDENEQSLVFKFFKLQLQQPTKNDWVSTCKKDLEEMKINLKFEEIRMMSKENFANIVKSKIPEMAFKYLLNKRGSKGKEILYNRLEMAEYLTPNNDMLRIEEKQELFSVRNRMVNIGYNFGKKEKCIKCEENEDMTHIYDCKYLNKKTKEISFDKIFKGNLFQQIKAFRIFQENMRRRNEEKLNITKHLPCDPFVSDPLPSGRNG